jgi:hypothetical protein
MEIGEPLTAFAASRAPPVDADRSKEEETGCFDRACSFGLPFPLAVSVADVRAFGERVRVCP